MKCCFPCKTRTLYGGELFECVKNEREVDVRFAFCFPDIYDIAMSCLGYRILYGAINEHKNFWCERVMQPWPDFEKAADRQRRAALLA